MSESQKEQMATGKQKTDPDYRMNKREGSVVKILKECDNFLEDSIRKEQMFSAKLRRISINH